MFPFLWFIPVHEKAPRTGLLSHHVTPKKKQRAAANESPVNRTKQTRLLNASLLHRRWSY